MTNTTNNTQMRKGFTMIELIFVIVIIGILAAVAVPRLAATRDDAKMAICMNDASRFIPEISQYYTAKGSLSTIKEMTNYAEGTTGKKTNGFKTAGATLAATGNSVIYRCDGNDMLEYTHTRDANGTVTIGVERITANGTLDTTADKAGEALRGQGVTGGTGVPKEYKLGGNKITF